MKFAFLVHPLNPESTGFVGPEEHNHLLSAWGSDPLLLSSLLRNAIEVGGDSYVPDKAPTFKVVDQFLDIVGTNGNPVEGRIYQIPMDARSILEEQDRALEFMEGAVKDAAAWGAKVVGLGSMTGIVGGRGTWLAEHSSVAITTGNSLTTFSAVRNLLNAAAEFELDLSKETVAIVGIPGSIATAAARILADQVGELLLVGRRASGPGKKLAEELGCELLVDIETAMQRCRLFVTATSSGDCIRQADLQPGSVVVDVGVPTDVIGHDSERSDVLILTGGLTRLPQHFPDTALLPRLQLGHVPSCLGETILLALEDREESYSLGRKLDPERILSLGNIAEARGYGFSSLYSFGQPTADSQLLQFRKECLKLRSTARYERREPATLSELAVGAKERFARHMNPVLKSLSERSDLLRTFVAGEDEYLIDEEGNRYLDLVAGFGSLNLGHNHSDVVAAVQAALHEQAPGFAQSAVNPYAAALAEELVALSPEGIELAFFSNSGTESNEAGLKLARAATGRSGLLYCKRSYHGKSLGSLSVTGNPTYQKPFAPLLQGCESVHFGDLEALDTALKTEKFAAFIVEPIQAEGGMVVPPAGYLREAQALCNASGTLLMVDEVQTGLGRTGRMFAVEHDDVRPDILTVAKSLSGGLIPIGAMLTRRDLWMEAYGTSQNFALHTSTFSGGSLASAAGLAALRTLQRGRFADNAEEQGNRLRESLAALCEQHYCLKDVRGRGLLIGLEFEKLPEHLVTHWHSSDPSGIAKYMVPGFSDQIRGFYSVYVMQTLLNSKGIYAQLARSNPYVLRIQPPLTITPQQVDRIIQAIAECCKEMEFSFSFLNSMITRSTMGKHDVAETTASSVSDNS